MIDGSYHYMIDNQLAPEIWNYYLAQNSGTKVFAGGGPKFYAEDIKGYYTESAEAVGSAALEGQIDKVIEQAGYEATDEMRQSAEWLLSKGLPLTEENLVKVAHMDSVVILPQYRGYKLQYRLMEAAEDVLCRETEYSIWMATVHPDNKYSLGNVQAHGYEIVAEAMKYGGYPRYVLKKEK
jgi:ribosomal protein S18 acetylase RimI-like enzyme